MSYRDSFPQDRQYEFDQDFQTMCLSGHRSGKCPGISHIALSAEYWREQVEQVLDIM